MEALPPCPYTKSGRHELNAILPSEDDKPATLFCAGCGTTRTFSLALPIALDDLPADLIAKLSQRDA
jgi:hypothetical protein